MFLYRQAEEEIDGGFWLTIGVSRKGVPVIKFLIVYLEATIASLYD